MSSRMNPITEMKTCPTCGAQLFGTDDIRKFYRLLQISDPSQVGVPYLPREGRICLDCRVIFYLSNTGNIWGIYRCKYCRRVAHSQITTLIHNGRVCLYCRPKNSYSYSTKYKNLIKEELSFHKHVAYNASAFNDFQPTKYIHIPEKIRYSLNTCEVLKQHSEIMKDDPERLSTDFLKKIIRTDDCTEITD